MTSFLPIHQAQFQIFNSFLSSDYDNLNSHNFPDTNENPTFTSLQFSIQTLSRERQMVFNYEMMKTLQLELIIIIKELNGETTMKDNNFVQRERE
jgi:hypothetical protein